MEGAVWGGWVRGVRFPGDHTKLLATSGATYGCGGISWLPRRLAAYHVGDADILWSVPRVDASAGRLFSDSPVACDLTPCPYEVRIYSVGRVPRGASANRS